MGRKAKEQAALPADDFNAELAGADQTTSDQLATQLTVIDATYGDGLPYDRERLVNEARFLLKNSAEAMLEAGKRLIVLKEHEPHGEFLRIVEERLGMARQVAHRMMQASVKFLDPKRPNVSALSNLGKTKLYELMVLDDEELEELAEGGTVAGVDKDDIERMTSRELRAALRDLKAESRAEIEAKSASLASRDARITELEEKLHRQKKPTPERAEEAALKALNDHTLLVVREIEVGMLSMASELAREVGAESVDTLPERLTPALRAAMMQIAQAARLTAAQMGVALTYEEETPDSLAWLDEADAAIGQ